MGLTDGCILWLFFSAIGAAISTQETLRWKLAAKAFVALLVLDLLISTGIVVFLAKYQGAPVSFNR